MKSIWIVFFLFIISFRVFAFEYGLTSEAAVKIGMKNGVYKTENLDIYYIINDISKIPINIDGGLYSRNSRVDKLFNKAEKLWLKITTLDQPIMSSTYQYRSLCNVTANYYITTNQLYKAIPIYEKLVKESDRVSLLNEEIEAFVKLIDIYLSLGQIELANNELAQFKLLLDDYFSLELDDIEDNDAYSILVNTEYQKNRILYFLLNNSSEVNFAKIKSIFDFILQYYEYSYQAQFVQLTGVYTTEASFSSFDKNTIAFSNYYTNYEQMYIFAKYFAINGDKVRAKKALDLVLNALVNNASDTDEADFVSISKQHLVGVKEVTRTTSNASTKIELQRIPLKYNYLSSLYSADINYHLGNIKQAQIDIDKAEQRFNILINHYKKLLPKYQYLDGVIKTKRELLTIKANILEKEFHYEEACDVYDKLIISNEEIRESLPVNLRKSYFRGYAKDAYLGLIRSRAKIYEKEKMTEAFDNFLVALNLLSSRQLKDLKATADVKEQNLQELQASMSKKDLIYIVYDVESDIVIAGISKDEIFASIVPKNKTIDKELHEIKDDLVQRQIYDRERLFNLSTSFINPIKKFKNIKNIHLLCDGVISILPFDIYPMKDKSIFDKYRVDYLTFLNISNVDKKFLNMSFLAVADPLYDDNGVDKLIDDTFSQTRSADISGYFIRLPETRKEVETISTKMKTSKLLLGAQAKESIIKTIPLEKYNYIHFATHGILGGEIPDMNEPALVLAKEDGEDSLLSASEIAKLKLNTSLVVLSACNTGSGKYFRGEGITGIARAFKIAGSDEIIASLWPVDSAATEKLMEYFYDNISKGNSNSNALHLAKKQLQTNSIVSENVKRGLQKKSADKEVFIGYSNPYFWSAFILIK